MGLWVADSASASRSRRADPGRPQNTDTDTLGPKRPALRTMQASDIQNEYQNSCLIPKKETSLIGGLIVSVEDRRNWARQKEQPIYSRLKKNASAL